MATNEAHKTRSRHSNNQAKEIVYNVHQFFVEEKGNRYPVINPSQVMERTAKATNVSKSTIRKICIDEKKHVQMGNRFWFSSQTKNKGNDELKRLTHFDDFDHSKEVLRRKVLSYYERKELPTLDKINEAMVQ